jgi:hypothetical protein
MHIDVEGAECPNACRHCAVDGHPPHGKFFSWEELQAIRKEWGPLWVFYEPTAYPGFPETYNGSLQPDHAGWLVTNGYGLARRKDYRAMLDRMVEIGICIISLTLHGLREHHDWFVCRQGAFDDILLATRRAREAGFHPVWQVYVDHKGLGDVPPLVDIAVAECGEPPRLSIPGHRVSRRLWQYEKIRPTLQDVLQSKVHRLLDDPKKNGLADPEAHTAAAWLERWRQSPDADEFKHVFEPRVWPPQATYEHTTISIRRDRKVYFEPMCTPPILLGKLEEGRKALLARLESIQFPEETAVDPARVALSPRELKQLHPSGDSVRYLCISKARFAR